MDVSPRASSRRSDLEAIVAAPAELPWPAAAAAPVATSAAAPGASIAFDGVTLAIPLAQARGDDGPTERLLLQDITGVVPAGEMCALMGSRCAPHTQRARTG